MASEKPHDLICYFCGVAFNIIRTRTIHEPWWASWGSDQSFDRNVKKYWVNLSNCIGRNCHITKSVHEGSMRRPKFWFPADYPRELATQYPTPEPQAVGYTPINEETLALGNYARPDDISDVEHIPGPMCYAENAYNGNHITLQEMRGCRTVQFLLPVEPSTWPKKDGIDENWEFTSGYFRSGLCNGLSMNTTSRVGVLPARGGITGVDASQTVPQGPMNELAAFGSNRFFSFRPRLNFENMALPFHPWCFEIFTRCSKLHIGHLAMDGLKQYRKGNEGYTVHYNPTNMKDPWSHQPRWEHRRGEEYKAANPLDVPSLENILLKCIKAGRGARNIEETENDSLDQNTSTAATVTETPYRLPTKRKNCLAYLPLEVQRKINEQLDIKDIKSLRLVSKNFQHLPDKVWCRMVQEDMPWLFEAWYPWYHLKHEPSIWTCLTASDMLELESCVTTHEPIQYGDLMKDFASHGIPQVIARPEKWPRETCETHLPEDEDKIYWGMLYTSIKRDWLKLKGLRNRKRIWDLIVPMIEQIKSLLEKPISKA